MVKEVLDRVKKNEGSLEDIFFSLGQSKNVKVLVEIFKKLYPDVVKGDFNGEVKITWQSKKS